MKITRKTMKGACLLLLGLLTASGARSHAADIMTTSFDKLAEAPADAAVATTDAIPAPPTLAPKAAPSPFLDEAPTPPTAHGTASNPGPMIMESSPPCCTVPGCCDDCFMGEPGRFWFRGEYMKWWTNGSRVPPLVSTVTDLANPGGTLQTVYGDRTIRDGDHDGYRADFGMWLDKCHCWGVEAEYFDFQGRDDNYDSGFSNGFNNGTVFPIVRAFVNPNQRGTTQVDAVAFPSQFVGRATVDTGDFFQSAGMWIRRNLRASEWSANGCDVLTTDPAARTFRLDAIGGYRFTRMIDFVNIRDDEVDIIPPNIDANYATVYTNVDNFRTVNTFNGAEFGLDAVATHGRWSLDLLGKLALGVNTQDVELYGLVQSDASVTGGPINGSTPTVETLSLNRFSWMPELTVTGGYQFTDHVKFTVAYDIIYWSEVARAGNQITSDPTTGIPFGPQPPLTPASVNETFFWAQGVRVGGEIRF